MPTPALKSYAQKSGKSLSQVESIWDEAKKSAKEKFSKEDDHYWAYVNGIVKKRLELSESTTFREFIDLTFEPSSVTSDAPNSHVTVGSTNGAIQDNYGSFIATLFSARDRAHELHLSTRSYAEHSALNELYDELFDYADEMAETFQGKYGIVNTKTTELWIQPDAKTFVSALVNWLEVGARQMIGTDSFILNLHDELIAAVYRVKYKIDNLS